MYVHMDLRMYCWTFGIYLDSYYHVDYYKRWTCSQKKMNNLDLQYLKAWHQMRVEVDVVLPIGLIWQLQGLASQAFLLFE